MSDRLRIAGDSSLGQLGEHREAGKTPRGDQPWPCSRSFAEKWGEETDALATQLLLARRRLPDAQISGDTSNTSSPAAEGHRSESCSAVAKAHAALSGRDQVEADDCKGRPW